MFGNLFLSREVKAYQRHRKAAKKLNHTIVESYVDQEILGKAGRALNLLRGHTMMLDSEDDLSYMMDYALYEVWRKGKNIVQRYLEEEGSSNPEEEDLLAAMVKAKTGLFRVEEIDAKKCQLVLQQLDEDRTITLTDIGFSQTGFRGLVMFIRPLETEKFTHTSGVAMLFPAEMEDDLIRKWQRKWKSESAKRYAELFKLFKRKGYGVGLI